MEAQAVIVKVKVYIGHKLTSKFTDRTRETNLAISYILRIFSFTLHKIYVFPISQTIVVNRRLVITWNYKFDYL